MEVMDEYDVLYPEYIENIPAGETLNLNESELGLHVEHIKQNAEPSTRNDVIYQVEYDEEQWTDIKVDESLPVLQRTTTDGTRLDIVAYDTDQKEICRRSYEFDGTDYNVYFENLRNDEYSTYFYNDEAGQLQLEATDLDKSNTEVSWEVGYRREEQEDEEDSFVSDIELSADSKFWSKASNDDYILEINGEKLSNAYTWLRENVRKDYWFEVRAHVMVNGVEVGMAQAGVDTRETRVEYYFPGDEQILAGDGWHIERNYDGWREDKNHLNGTDIQVTVNNISIVNEEGEKDDTPVCTIQNAFYDNEDGWDIRAERVGTAVVTMTYTDEISQEEKEYSYHLYVTTDKYMLEPQFTPSGNTMLKNGKQQIPFILRHEWRHSDEDEGSEEVTNWTLNFDPDRDQDGWKYDEKLLKDVKIQEDHTLLVESGEETWGTDILLKATLSSEEGAQDIAYYTLHIEVMAEYDVLYPDQIDNIKVGETLNLNNLGVRVEHEKEGENPVVRNDVSFEFRYDPDQWANVASEGEEFPVLMRKTEDALEITIVVKKQDGTELFSTPYWLDDVESPLRFDDLRKDEYWTFVYKDEEAYEISVNTENLISDATVNWRLVSRQYGSENWSDESEDFWSVDKKDPNKIIIQGEKLAAAQESMNNYGYNWYEVQAYIKVGETELNSYAAFGLESVKTKTADSFKCFPVQNSQQVLMTETLWIPKEYNCWVEDGEHPFGGFVPEPITKLTLKSPADCVKITEKEEGWIIRPLKRGNCIIDVSFHTIFGDESRELTFKFVDKVYWMECSFADDNDQMIPGETKLIDVAVYYRTAENSEKVLVSPTEYTLDADSSEVYQKPTVDKKKSQISLKGKSSEEPYTINVRVYVSLNEKNEYDESVWYSDDTVMVSAVSAHDDAITFTRTMDAAPEMGETLDLNAYGPIVKRYDSSKKTWNEVNKDNIRFRLEYDEEVWTATEETADDPIPVLIKKQKAYTEVRLVAEEYAYNPKFGREEWMETAERYIEVQDSMCAHDWKTQKEQPATCGTDGSRHKKCTICTKEKDEIIPATGRHSYGEWSITKESTCVAEGEKTATCEICKYTKTELIEKIAHEYEWVTDRNATCSAEGSRHEECKICHTTGKTESIEKTAHVYEWVTDRNATCSAEGSCHEECKVCHAPGKTESIGKTAHSYQWKTDVAATCGKDGSRHEECGNCGSKGKTEKIAATGAHTLGSWKVTHAATAVAEGTKERYCVICGGAKETGSVAKLKASISLNVPTNKKLPLKVKQSYQVSAFQMASGDKVISWTSSNKKIVAVSGNGKITGKKNGQAVITVKLQSGLTASFTVKVQKAAVATTSLLVVDKATGIKAPKNVNLKAKQKLALQTTITPVTSKQKVTYKSSNKKIVTVNSKGVITAKKNGTATITVKSGKKSVKIKVKVMK